MDTQNEQEGNYTRRRTHILLLILLLMGPGMPLFGSSEGLPILNMGQPDHDILVRWRAGFQEQAATVSMTTFWFLVRIAFALIIQTVAAAEIFRANNNVLLPGALMAIQWIICAIVFFVIIALPLESIAIQKTAQGWILMIALTAIVVLPWRLSFYLVPLERHRRVVASLIYVVISALFLAQISR